MKSFLLLIVSLLFFCTVQSQDFSNKGKDFWVGYGYHERMGSGSTGGTQDMVLYFATEAVTTITITIPGVGYSQTFTNIPANTIFETPALPKTGAQDARLTTEGKLNKGIHITSDKPVVAYAHIYNASISGATLLFPTVTLGKEYYSVNYKNISNSNNANCWFYVCATDTGTTTVEITPSATTLTRAANVPFTVDLKQGEIYNVMGILTSTSNPFTGVDLTGSKIKSISAGPNGCKKIAVFSGSGRISLTCNTSSSSSDNYMVQSLPKTAWGQKYLTVPTGANLQNNFFRICVTDQATIVKVNGLVLNPAGLINNFYYEIGPTSAPNLIESDKPVMVAQYITSQGACGNGTPGDPEVIYLSPVEQNINKVILNSTFHNAITQHYINVIIPNTGTAISSFKLDGATPVTSFIVHPQNPGFSYLQQVVTQGQHTIQSDSGFNAIAYGYGQAESYGYNAGTNVKDLYQFIGIINQYGIVNEPSACAGTPFNFSITLPYEPISLFWDFKGSQTPNVTQNNPVFDTTYFVNGKQVWRYSIKTPYLYAAGTYPVTVTSNNPTPEGCSGEQDIDFDLTVYNPPVADFVFQNTGCAADSVSFQDATIYTPGTFSYKWYWNFGDGTTDTVRNPKHRFLTAGVYTVKYSLISNVGCLSDTATKQITITDQPVANFLITAPQCLGKSITFTDQSSIAVNAGTLVKWYWDYGDGSKKDTFTISTNPTHIYTSTGNFNATLKVETNTGCQSSLFTSVVNVHPNPVVNFSLPKVCLPDGLAQFFDSSSIADGSESQFNYLWNFGDVPSGAANTSTIKNPTHSYNNAGPFNVMLQVTSKDGCVSDITKILSTVYPQSKPAFTVLLENCISDSTYFTDQSNGQGSTVTEWYWDFGDASTSSLQNPVHKYAAPNTYTVKLYIKTDKGCLSDTIIKQVIVNPLPTASFTNSSPLCETKTVTFTSTSTANAGNITIWNWNLGDGTTLTLNTGAPFTHTYTTAGTYSVSLFVQTDKGCTSATLTSQIIVNPQPQPGFILPEVCLSDAFAQFIDTSKIGSGTITTWAWNFGDPSSGILNTSSLKNPQHKYNAIGSYTATLTITSNSGCVATLAQTFTVNGDIPVANFNTINSTGLCANDSVAIQDASSVNFGSITKVEIYWDNTGTPLVFQTDDLPSPGKIYKHLYPNLQTNKTYSIRYRAYSGATCVNDRVKNITVNAAPKVQFNSIPNTCLNVAPYQITQASEVGGVPGTAAFTGIGISSSGIFSPTTAGVGTHILKYTFTSSNGCIDTASQSITILPPPVADFTFSAPDCETRAITFSDNSTASSGTIKTWTWNFGDGTPLVIKNSPAPFTHVFETANTYSVSLTVTTNDGCNSAVASKSIKINPLPVVDFSVSKTCLPVASAQFTDLTTITDGTANQFTYLWNFGDPNSGTANTSTLKNPVHTYSAMGPYNVTLQVTSVDGCVKDTIKIYNDIHPQPKANFSANPTAVCVGTPIRFTDNSNGLDGSIQQYNWLFGDGNSSSQQNPSHTFNTAGTYNVKLFIVNSQGCTSDTFQQSVIIYPFPVVNAGPDRTVLEGGTIILEPVVSGNGLQYLWTPNLYLSSNTVINPVVSGVADITYTLTVTATGGCVASDQVFVKVLKFPVIPNTFTPNGDGINDQWVIQNLETYPDARVQVFNRYGQLVFESRGYGKPWTGIMNGRTVPFGTYYYVIEPGNGRKPITGYVTLIK